MAIDMSTHAESRASGTVHDLQLVGEQVSRCSLDYRFTLEFLEDGFAFISVACPFDLVQAGRKVTLDPEDLDKIGRAFCLVRKTVEAAHAHEDGTLDVTFEDGYRLTVPPHPQYEAWEGGFPNGLKLVALPGGGLAIWRYPELARPPRGSRPTME